MSDLAQNPPAVRTVLAGLMLSIFLSALDQTIVAVSLPAISADFADLDLLAWVISAYMVAMTVSMPIYGKLGDLYGRRRLMLFAIVVFTAASLLCGLAQSMGQLVLARVLQGIGAGGLMAVSQAIIGDIVPPRERGRYQGYFSSMYAIASVAGPVLGACSPSTCRGAGYSGSTCRSAFSRWPSRGEPWSACRCRAGNR
ncbi:MFS family transporter [Pseudomonas aeruginosa]|nr:MFS family transporter [Pseudomonas aeruginosa]